MSGVSPAGATRVHARGARRTGRAGGPGATLVIIGLILAVVAGGIGGAWLGDRASEAGTERLVIDDPALAAATDSAPLRSAGGFTGFGGLPALPGEVLRPGVVESVADGVVEVATDAAVVRVRYTSLARLFRLGAADRGAQAGDTVVLQLSGGVVTGVLIVPSDIEEGIGTGGQ